MFNSQVPHLQSIKIPTEFKKLKEFDCIISYDEAVQTNRPAAAHIFIWSQLDYKSLNKSPANVMMHLRFDGKFGFPGGLVDSGEEILTALNRELSEEIGWEVPLESVNWSDYICSMIESKYVLHLFGKELSIENYTSLEKKCLEASEYGKEVLGTVRIPLYTRKDNYGGFPAFLDNVFISKAKYQLFLGLWHSGILTAQDIINALNKSNFAVHCTEAVL